MINQHPHNTVRKRAFPAWLCVVLSLLSSVANAEIEGLFSDAGDALSLEPPSSPDIPPIQRRIVRMDLGQLDAARKEVLAGRPTYLTLNLFDEVSFQAIVERTGPTLSGHSLSGRLEGIPFGTMALVLNDTVVMGKVRTPDAIYTIRSAGAGTYMIQRAHPFEFTEAPPLKPVPPASALLSRTDAMATEEDDGSEIDVFVLWTSAAKDVFGGTRPVQASIDLAIVETNDAYAASGVTQRIRLVGAVEVNYDGPEHIETHFRRLVSPSDGYLDEAHTLRDSYAADLVHLALGGGCNSFGFDGLAYAMTDPSPSFESSAFSVSVFCDDFLDGRGLSSRAFAHELGHNMGLQHDRYARFTTLNKPYPYSHGYVNQKAFEDGVTDRARWRTIMSYNDQCADAGFDCQQILQFSNPDQRYNGHPLGISGDDPSDEVDGPADAARSLDETRHIVANFRRSASRCTYRLAQETVTVPAAGGSFSISVESEPDCAYRVQSHDEHLSVTSGSTNRGDGTVTYQVAANEGDARVGSISVAGETLIVRQSGIHAVASVCDRTPEIRDAIMTWSGRGHCSEVTDFDLSEIPYLVLSARGITELRTGDFSGLSSLYWLSLDRNSITGRIPPELGRLTKLRVLGLAGNRLTGSIPPELGRLTKVTLLTLSGNKLTGNIPPELGEITELNTLDLSDNMLSGNIPVELGRLSNVNTLDLSDNMLTGGIPSELGNIPRLSRLDLSGNRLSGPIPVWSENLQSLWLLHLHDNQLTGTIPTGLGSVPRLRELRLHNNRLTGAIPAELSLPERLRVLHLAGNALTGCIPGTLRDVADNDLDQLALGYCAVVSLAHGGPPDAPREAGRVTEGSAASLTIITEPEQEAAFDVTVTISGGEAFGVSRGNRMVTIPSGTTETTLYVDTENDDVEEPDGAFTVTILADAEFALIGSRSSASIVIDDDEGPSAPTIVSLTPADGMLTVAWTAPPSGDTPIREGLNKSVLRYHWTLLTD
ncbi:MAG: M12 family metallo-peptidase, partial [Gammaproteobacteria bacterium]|nr:M12 family metallo-peptidase [Gammaproteobacteria bacterium]